MTAPTPSNEPYCSACGYVLTGLTESSKCPECGKPLTEVLIRPTYARMNAGKRFRSKATLFGWPVVDVALGPKDGQTYGHAKGIIAIGDIATGGIAVGGMARGVVAVGGLALGLFSFGGAAVGLVSATGGLAVGALAAGGGAIGILAAGGGAIGYVAQGGGAFGAFVRDARVMNAAGRMDDVFTALSWFFGPWPLTPTSLTRPMIVTLSLTLAAAILIGLVAWARLSRERPPTEATRTP